MFVLSNFLCFLVSIQRAINQYHIVNCILISVPYFSVHDYMRWFGQVTEPNPKELLRHSVHQTHLDREAHYTDNDHEQELLRIIHV